MAIPQTLILTLVFFLTPSSSQVILTVSPKTLTKTHNTVNLRWSGIESPSNLDWIGIYSPADSKDDNFIGYLLLNGSVSGSITLPLTNLRSNYTFRIFHQTLAETNLTNLDHDNNPLPVTIHKLAEAEEVGFEGREGPDQVHLAYTDREDEMRVVFLMGVGEGGRVRWGRKREGGRWEREVGTEVRRYDKEDMCDEPARGSVGWRDPGWVHDGVMGGLERETRYFYQVGSDTVGWSPIYSFISRNNEATETNAFLFGDMGTAVPYLTFFRAQEESRSTVKWILRDMETIGDKPVFVSHIGDISYARGYSWMWDEFFNLIEPIASKLPYHVCIGNHEYDWPLQPWRPTWALNVYQTDGGGECGVPYSIKFKMPGNSSFATGTRAPHTRNLYYSFDSGVVHFLYISTETNFLQGSDQYNFIKSDLEGVNRDKTPFVVVQGHRPMYTTSNELRDAPMREKMLEHLEPLFVENKVTLALWGHVHRYERFCPLRNYTCGDMSSNFTYGGLPVHVVIGMGGQDWQPTWEPRPDHKDVPIYPQPERSMYRGGEFGYTRLFATREKLTLTYIGNHDGQIHDVLEIFSGLSEDSAVGEVVVESARVLKYVMGSGVLILGAFVGYLLGFLTRYRRNAATTHTWTPVKIVEM